MSAFPGIDHFALGEKYKIYINMVLGFTNMPTFQNTGWLLEGTKK